MKQARKRTRPSRRLRGKRQQKEEDGPQRPKISTIELPRKSLVEGILRLPLTGWVGAEPPSRSEYLAAVDGDGSDAEPPGVPDPYEDGPLILPSRSKRRRTNYARKRFEESGIRVREEASVVATAPAPRTRPADWNTCPPEVRLEILKCVLVAPRPIKVNKKWEKLYPRQEFQISTGVLRANKQCHAEGIGILYGCNVFHYLIRDAPGRSLNVDELQHDVGWNDSGDSDYNDADPQIEVRGYRRRRRAQRESRAVARRRQATAKRKKGKRKDDGSGDEPVIGVRRHLHLFRHVTVEVEYNRADDQSAQLMAEAIMVFAPVPQHVPPIPFKQDRAQYGAKRDAAATRQSRKVERADTSPLTPKIHTMSLYISPIWESQSEVFSMINWFSPAGEIMGALNTISCQRINIYMRMNHFFDKWNQRSGQGPAALEAPKSARFQLDMCYRYMATLAHEPEETACEGVEEARRRRLRRGEEIMSQLGQHLLSKCTKTVPEDLLQNSNTVFDGAHWTEVDGSEDHADV